MNLETVWTEIQNLSLFFTQSETNHKETVIGTVASLAGKSKKILLMLPGFDWTFTACFHQMGVRVCKKSHMSLLLIAIAG